MLYVCVRGMLYVCVRGILCFLFVLLCVEL